MPSKYVPVVFADLVGSKAATSIRAKDLDADFQSVVILDDPTKKIYWVDRSGNNGQTINFYLSLEDYSDQDVTVLSSDGTALLSLTLPGTTPVTGSPLPTAAIYTSAGKLDVSLLNATPDPDPNVWGEQAVTYLDESLNAWQMSVVGTSPTQLTSVTLSGFTPQTITYVDHTGTEYTMQVLGTTPTATGETFT